MLHAAWIESLFIQRSPPNSLNSPAPCWLQWSASRRPLVSPEFLSSMWAGLIRIIRTMAEARSVKWKQWRKIIHPSSSRCWQFTPWCHSQKNFIDASEDKELTLRVMERAQISRGIIQYCRKDGTLCEEGQTWGQGWARIWAKGPGNLFQFHCDS